jgi:hypothetical protein
MMLFYPDSDAEDLTDRDLDHQFGIVKANTPNSPVTRYLNSIRPGADVMILK